MKTITQLMDLLKRDKEKGKKSDGFVLAINDVVIGNGEKAVKGYF